MHNASQQYANRAFHNFELHNRSDKISASLSYHVLLYCAIGIRNFDTTGIVPPDDPWDWYNPGYWLGRQKGYEKAWLLLKYYHIDRRAQRAVGMVRRQFECWALVQKDECLKGEFVCARARECGGGVLRMLRTEPQLVFTPPLNIPSGTLPERQTGTRAVFWPKFRDRGFYININSFLTLCILGTPGPWATEAIFFCFTHCIWGIPGPSATGTNVFCYHHCCWPNGSPPRVYIALHILAVAKKRSCGWTDIGIPASVRAGP